MKRFLLPLICIVLGMSECAYSQTIAEKKASLGQISSDLTPEMQAFLVQLNAEHEEQYLELERLYNQARELHQQCVPEQAYKDLLIKINAIKKKMTELQRQWREMASRTNEDEYALWHQPNATLEQLIIDYGSQDFVYLIPPEIAEMTISIASNLPIPRSSWGEMLEIILAQNGVGIRQLNPFLRELYLFSEDRSNLRLITNRRHDLVALPDNARVAFMLTPEPSEVRRVWLFLEKFVNPRTTAVQMIGRDILVIASVSEVLELLKLYDFVASNRGDKEYKVVTLSRIDAEEMAKILGAIFGVLSESPNESTESTGSLPKGLRKPSGMPRGSESRPVSAEGGENGLKIIPLAQVAQAIFLVGTREEIRKAENIIQEVEDQVGESRGKLIYWYTTRHSDPEELAQVLAKVYYLMVAEGIGFEDGPPAVINTGEGNDVVNVTESQQPQQPIFPPPPFPPPPRRRPYEQGFFYDEGFVVNRRLPPQAAPVNQNRDNFLVDPKTGAIVMVVEADILPKIKELIKRLDVAKRMVQIEVLLFEKRMSAQNNYGLNLLRIGKGIADNIHKTGLTFNSRPTPDVPLGIFQFLLSREAHCNVAPYDVAYQFLLTQDDVHINAAPSVLAVNQTPAVIDIADEISIKTGIYAVDTVGGVTLDNAFARAEYGIKIEVTPIIHMPEEGEYFDDESPSYVTLQTDIRFQTIRPGPQSQQPDVTTRRVINEVNIPDGQTVILGGLRQRNTHDLVEKIPFLGEIPGIGKLFSLNQLQDDTTEMFIFITPKIVIDPVDDLERIRMRQLFLRPGDIPGFLCRLAAAEEWETSCLAESTMAILFGRRPSRCINFPLGEYDGR
jgi:general secretion pathway protein D